MSVANTSTIRRMVDLLIGENLTSLSDSDSALRCTDAAMRRLCHCYISVKNTSNVTQLRVVHAMNKNRQSLRRRHMMDYAFAAMEQMELYCKAHPGSPSAVRRPQLFVRGDLWVALLGPTVEEGIVGIGATVTAALRAFDSQYLAGLRPRAETIDGYRPSRNGSSAVA